MAASTTAAASAGGNLITDLLDEMNESLRTDEWGQIVEASDAYDKAIRIVNEILESPSIELPEKAFFSKLRKCLSARKYRLTSETGGAESGPSMEEIASTLSQIRKYATRLVDEYTSFPVDLSNKQWGATNSELGIPDEREVRAAYRRRAAETLKEEGGKTHDKIGIRKSDAPDRADELGPRELLDKHLANLPAEAKAGEQYLVIDIHKIGLKDAEIYQEPMITVSVADSRGVLTEPPQNTDIADLKERRHVSFDARVYIQTPLDRLVEKNCAVFFEFKHYKRKKKYVSVRCWSFMEMDEVLPEGGPLALEIYQKPTDVYRKKINLHSKKSLYLHLTAYIVTVPDS
eukprot:gb/GECG01011177.1/.p1 GENE.gb/GECG01011177.1/~~gb/GECG01011177.1/.p1  ORF type:complete len:346 (+),score=46.46 gb/GECG01011177.1/:1-1038(+)